MLDLLESFGKRRDWRPQNIKFPKIPALSVELKSKNFVLNTDPARNTTYTYEVPNGKILVELPQQKYTYYSYGDIIYKFAIDSSSGLSLSLVSSDNNYQMMVSNHQATARIIHDVAGRPHAIDINISPDQMSFGSSFFGNNYLHHFLITPNKIEISTTLSYPHFFASIVVTQGQTIFQKPFYIAIDWNYKFYREHAEIGLLPKHDDLRLLSCCEFDFKRITIGMKAEQQIGGSSLFRNMKLCFKTKFSSGPNYNLHIKPKKGMLSIVHEYKGIEYEVYAAKELGKESKLGLRLSCSLEE